MWPRRSLALLALVAVVLGACALKGQQPTTYSDMGPESTLLLTSSAFEPEGPIPSRHTCDGEDLSPPMVWSETPEGTVSYVLIVDDLDAPGGSFVHWVLYNLPAEVTELPEGLPPEETLPGGGMQGMNGFGRVGYGGPCPPSGTHRYYFVLYALDAALDLEPGASNDLVRSAMADHILTEAVLVGSYAREG